MPEFMVKMIIRFPAGLEQEARKTLLDMEAAACAPYLDSGEMARVWRTSGDHMHGHGHLSLWCAENASYVLSAYASFPLVKRGYVNGWKIIALEVNPNDRVMNAQVAGAPFPLTAYSRDNNLLYGDYESAVKGVRRRRVFASDMGRDQ